MKTHQLIYSIAFIFCICLPGLSANNLGDPITKMNEPSARKSGHPSLQEKADVLMSKILQLKEEKKVAESRIEKKQIRVRARQLRAELNALEAEAKATGQEIKGGVYIGSGTLILILLLILLL